MPNGQGRVKWKLVRMQCATTNPLFLSLILWGSTKAPSKSGFAYKISVVSISFGVYSYYIYIRFVLSTLFFLLYNKKNHLVSVVLNICIFWTYAVCNFLIIALETQNLHIHENQSLKLCDVLLELFKTCIYVYYHIA